MDHLAFRALIDSEPLNGARTDLQVLDDWWMVDVTVQTDIDYQTFMVWASEEGIARKIKLAIANEEKTPGTWIASVYNDTLVVDHLLQGGGDISMSRDDIRTIVVSISGSGLPLSTANKNALNQKSNVDTPRWKAEGYDPQSDESWLAHISIARAL